MNKNIAQVRYYGDNDQRNYPLNLTGEKLITGAALDSYYPIIQLGIQASPVISNSIYPIFYINNSNSPIQVGFTGIYELDLSNGYSHITNLQFKSDFINAINEASPLIIDMVYKEE